jgi:hypothetical protein
MKNYSLQTASCLVALLTKKRKKEKERKRIHPKRKAH